MPATPRRRGRVAAVLLAAGLFPIFPGWALGASGDDFIAGYATAILERELTVEAEVAVADGEVTVRSPGLEPALRAKLEAVLAEVEGVRSVRVEATPPEGAAPAPPDASQGVARRGVEVLPDAELFAPLLADPRWPHFSAAALHYAGDEELANVAATSFGESIPLLATDAPWDARVELALHAGVFSIFDLDASSFDLVNSDFLVGLAGTWRRGNLAVLARVLHQSSHLGDEFLLRGRVERVNLSFEELDLLLSYDLGEAFRVYGGGGWLLRTDPDDLDPGSLQLGLEFASPRTFWGGLLRPVAGLDLQARHETDWEPDLSARAGLQLENPRLWTQRVQLLLEFYDGRSPNGQFFERDVTYYGLGTHVHF